MPLSLKRGRVTGIQEQHEEIVRLEVDGIPCVAYPEVTEAEEVEEEPPVPAAEAEQRSLRIGVRAAPSEPRSGEHPHELGRLLGRVTGLVG